MADKEKHKMIFKFQFVELLVRGVIANQSAPKSMCDCPRQSLDYKFAARSTTGVAIPKLLGLLFATFSLKPGDSHASVSTGSE